MARVNRTWALLLIVLWCSSSDGAEAGVVATQCLPLNIRSGPGLEHPVITRLESGTPVHILHSVNFSWSHVRIADGREGYAARAYIGVLERYTFLEDSPLLRSMGVTIAPADDSKDLVRLDSRHYRPGEPCFLLGAQEQLPRPLLLHRSCTHHSSIPPLDWSCGDPTPTLYFTGRSEQRLSGHFVVFGKHAEQGLVWIPGTSKIIDASPCPSTSPQTLRRTELLSLPQRPELQLYRSVHSDQLPDSQVQVFSMRDAQGHCRVLGHKQLYEERVEELIGAIEISWQEQQELWLVFQAVGYEGEAYYGLRLSKPTGEEEDRDHFYVYSGC